MKVKRFENLWTMGLLLVGAILVVLYIVKIFFPQFIVKVAEIPRIVKIGNYIDSHKWCYYLFNGLTSFLILYFYACGCCRIKLLDYKEILIVIGLISVSHLIEEFIPNQLLAYNFALYLIIPLIIATKRKFNDYSIFNSTAICSIVTTFAQSISLEIRGISTLVSYPNTATYFILLIDAYIWNLLLYNYFNYKKGETNNG